MKRKIATKIESMKRVHQIYQWLNHGKSTKFILRNSLEQWGIQTGQTEVYLRRARQLLAKRFEKESHGQMADIIKKLDEIHARNFEEGELRLTDKGHEYIVYDSSVARQALMDKAKLLGLIQNNVNLNVNDEREHTEYESNELESIADQTQTIN